MKKLKVLIISNLIYPLRIPLFELLNKSEKYTYEFLFLRKTLRNRNWKIETDLLHFDYRILPGVEIPIRGKDYFPLIVNPTTWFEITNIKPDVIISIGWAYPANFIALIYSKLRGSKFIIWSESTDKERTIKRTLSLPIVKSIIKVSDGFLASSTKAKRYFQYLGAKDNKVTVVGNAIDNNYYRNQSVKYRKDKSSIKASLGIDNKGFVIIYVGRFEKVKGLRTLLEAYRNLNYKKNKVYLILLGYGPQLAELKLIVDDEKIKNVIFIGPLERFEIIKYYAIADLLILPSISEVWGYVVNEALACGVPVITSDSVGSSEDLIKDWENGVVIPTGDSNSLKNTIDKILHTKGLHGKMVENCYPMISKYSYQKMRDRVEERINKTVEQYK